MLWATTTARQHDGMNPPDDWTAVVDLIERVMGDEDLLPSVISGVRATVREVSVLPPSDIAGHTRALLTAATRAMAARRGPTEAELSFVAELGVTRARQGVPIEAVLGAIHVAERAIWARAREVARAEGVSAERLLDAHRTATGTRPSCGGCCRAARQRPSRSPRPGCRPAAGCGCWWPGRDSRSARSGSSRRCCARFWVTCSWPS
jgi:hypothetical protein